jgi:hypothetical protein
MAWLGVIMLVFTGHFVLALMLSACILIFGD